MLEQLRVGAAIGSEGTTTVAQQVVKKRQIVSEKDTEIKASKAKLKTLTKDKTSIANKMKKSSTQNQNDVKQLAKCKSELAIVEQKISEIDFDESRRATLSQSLN